MKPTKQGIFSIFILLLTGFIIMHSMANATTPEENDVLSKAFLAKNAKKDKIMITDTGLQYKVITEGTGKTPDIEDNVTVHYRGMTIDGKEFDSSYDRGEPTTFPVSRVIPGWTEGLQLMKEGSKYRFFIPSYLGYGKKGAGRVIPPNSALVFDVELIKVE